MHSPAVKLNSIRDIQQSAHTCVRGSPAEPLWGAAGSGANGCVRRGPARPCGAWRFLGCPCTCHKATPAEGLVPFAPKASVALKKMAVGGLAALPGAPEGRFDHGRWGHPWFQRRGGSCATWRGCLVGDGAKLWGGSKIDPLLIPRVKAGCFAFKC